MNYHYYYFLNILFAFFAFAPPPLRLLSSATDAFSLCNVKNGRIFVENKCQNLLLCYQSNLANGNAKIGRHFRAKKGTNGKENFTECAEEMKGKEWHGLSIVGDEYGKIRFESSLGFDGIFGTNQIEQMENQMEIDMDKFFEPFRMELQNALSFGPFFGEFREMIMAFDFVSPNCGQKDNTKLCKAKCLSQTMTSKKSSKSHGISTQIGPISTSSIPIPTTTEQTFSFVPFSRHFGHFGTICTEIIFPNEIDKFILNITASPYEIGCKKYQKPTKMNDPDRSTLRERYFDACKKVPTEKCQGSEKLIVCYKSTKKSPGNSSIAELCQKHFEGNSDANFAGFVVQICVHREQNELIVETTFNETYKKTRSFPISFEKMTDILKWMPVYFIEFGTNQQKSAIREKDGEENLNKNNDGIGTVLNEIVSERVNGTLAAKIIHFLPPSKDAKMHTFFQILKPKYSKLITKKTNLMAYENDPNKFNRPTMCDYYGDDCEPIRNLLLKIEKLENCGKEDNDTDESMFKPPDWAPMPPTRIIPKPSESLLCEEDLYCDKKRLQMQYNYLRKICGLEPEKVEENNNRRQKRQYDPYEKWTEFPIKICVEKKGLPEEDNLLQNAMEIGAKLIMELTCVRFEFVDEMEDGKDGISVLHGEGYFCGYTSADKIGGWKDIQLAMTNFWCFNHKNMSVVAGHELLHALGLRHEQRRSDARNFVILREKDKQSEIKSDTQNFDFDYDFGSVLHYGADGDHEKRLYDKITLPRFYQQTIGQRERISFKDAAIINRIYCNDSCNGNEDKCQNGGYLNPNDCAKCHCPDGYGGQYCDQLEENLNCVDVSGIPRELKANQTKTVLKPKTKCTANDQSKCQSNWRIKPEAGKKARIQFKSLNGDLFKCTYNCSEAYVEVKYRADKRVQGAKLCCPDAFGDPKPNEYKNWIEAEKPDSDIVISAHLSSNWTEPIIPFELTFESGDVKLTNSCKCVTSENLYYEERNPETGTLVCTHENGTEYDCSCYGDKKCLTEEKWCHDNFMCQIIKVNGKQAGEIHSYFNNSYRIKLIIQCYKAEGGTVNFWGYQEPNTTEIIRVDEIHCLMHKAVEVAPPTLFKSAGVEHGQQQDKSEQNSYHGNVSSLPFIHMPKSVFDP